jgi:hypothetical protein
MKKSTFDYKDVVETCHRLIKEGITPSIPSVRAALGGGSPNKILAYLRQWQKEYALSVSVEEDLSPEFKQAVLAECGRKLAAVRDRLQSQLDARENQVNTVQALLAASEAQVSKLTAELLQVKKDTEAASLAYEKQLAAASEQVTIRTEYADELRQKTEQQIATLQTQLQQMQESKHAADIRAATAEARHAEIEKRLISL